MFTLAEFVSNVICIVYVHTYIHTYSMYVCDLYLLLTVAIVENRCKFFLMVIMTCSVIYSFFIS